MDEMTLDVGMATLDTFTENPVIEEEPQVVVPTAENMEDNLSPDEAREIGTITSAAYGGFTKILSLLNTNMGKTDIISVKEGKLSTTSGGGYLYCDLSILFGANDIDIIDPQYSVKLMKLITGGDQVVFIDDPANERYMISNLVDDKPLININLKKPDPAMKPKIDKPVLGEKNEDLDAITPDLVNTITTAEKNLESQYFIVELNENPKTGMTEIVSISTDKKIFKYNFKDIWAANDNQETTEYKIFNPFPIAKPDDIQLELYKNPNGEFWIKTISEVGLANIEYMEKLNPIGVFDTFSLG